MPRRSCIEHGHDAEPAHLVGAIRQRYREGQVNSSAEQYNIAAIRNLIRDAFTAKELWRFCQDRPAFRPVLVHFGPSFSFADLQTFAAELEANTGAEVRVM